MRIVRPPTLTASVAKAVQDAIFRGELAPGEALRESDLSESMDVSRGTVREALRLLQDEGLVERFPHRGVFVRRLTPSTAHEIYTLRAVLEPMALRLCLERDAYRKGDMEELERLAQRIGELEQHGGPVYDTVKADVGFHRLVCSRCGHELLLHTLDSLQALTWLFVLNTKFYQSDLYSDEPPHYDIYEAIDRRDMEAASGVLEEHIRAAGVALLARMQELDDLAHGRVTAKVTADAATA